MLADAFAAIVGFFVWSFIFVFFAILLLGGMGVFK